MMFCERIDKRKNCRGQGFSINKLIIVILVVLVIATVLIFFLKIDINKYLKWLPDFGGDDGGDGGVNEENIEQGRILQENESCCCLYKDNRNTKECQIVELELNQFCSDKLERTSEGNWVNADDEYCENEKQ